jgi:hypothetical protein
LTSYPPCADTFAAVAAKSATVAMNVRNLFIFRVIVLQNPAIIP